MINSIYTISFPRDDAMKCEPIKSFEQFIYNLEPICESIMKSIGADQPELSYQRALLYELRSRDVRCYEEISISVLYGQHPISSRRIDILVEIENKKIVLELKHVKATRYESTHQIKRYMLAVGTELGYLINFSKMGTVEIRAP